MPDATGTSAAAPTGWRGGTRLEVRCERMVHGGLCIAHPAEGGTVLVDGGIPGELVEAELRFRKGRSWFASVLRAVEPSPDRQAAPCRYIPDCGGCQLQHVTYARQLELKREVVVDALRREGVSVKPEMRIIGMDDPWRYRWRGEFHVVPGASGVQDAGLGFNRARSWRPIAVDDCLIHHRAITDALPAMRDLVHRGGTDELTALHVTLGEDERELLVRGKPRRALADAAVDAVAAELRDSLRFSIDSTTLRWRGHVFRVTPESFIQVNWTQMDALYSCAMSGLGDIGGLRIVDAYAGIGVLATEIAGRAHEVVCIESNRAAVRMGVLNARVNDVSDRVRYVPRPAEDALPAIAAEAPIDRLVLDPPRAGCGSRVTGWIALAGPPRVVYVSCDPATLARDLHVLVASGPYEVTGFDIVDMFPQTYHLESVVTLQRRQPPGPPEW